MAQTELYSERLSEQALDSWYLKSRHHFIADLLAGVLRGRIPAECRVLDAGCGSGGVTEPLVEKGYCVTSCDMDAAAIEQGLAKRRLRDAHVADVTRLPFDSATFDAAVCSEVLEHVEDDAKALGELLRVARDQVVISVPAHACLWTSSDTILGHHRRYSRPEFLALIQRAGARSVRSGRCHAIPGLGILAYKGIRRMRGLPPRGDPGEQTPNAARFRLPRWIDRLFYCASTAELRLSRIGLIPWGSAWWAIIEKRS